MGLGKAALTNLAASLPKRMASTACRHSGHMLLGKARRVKGHGQPHDAPQLHANSQGRFSSAKMRLEGAQPIKHLLCLLHMQLRKHFLQLPNLSAGQYYKEKMQSNIGLLS